MKKLFINIMLMSLSLMGAAACSESFNPKSTLPEVEDSVKFNRGEFAKGADVSWITQMESEGYKFSNADGKEMECMQLLRDHCGVNSIRLRVWVNPVEGWNNIQDVLVKARRADRLGMRLMIDFHFSDTWADPGHQLPPTAWADYDIQQLKTAVEGHVTEMLQLLKSYNIEPEWVQIGNETRNGMMLPVGDISNGDNFAQLLNSGYNAVKNIFADAKVIVHLDGGDNMYLYTKMFDYLKTNGGKYDLVGMSLYPTNDDWRTSVDKCLSNIQTIKSRYGTNVMLCEIGMNYDQAESCRDAISLLMTKGQESGLLEGIFYWEPEAPSGYNDGYNKGCFVDGKPTVALDAFK